MRGCFSCFYMKVPDMKMKDQSKFGCVVFAGGGNRCLWQAGFWSVAAPALNLRPSVIGGVSAGSAIACMLFSGKIEKGLKHFKEATEKNEKNFYAANILNKSPVFPHYGIYRNMLLKTIDQQGLEELRKGPEIRVLIAIAPRVPGPRIATLMGLTAYSLEKKIAYPMHPVTAMKLGFRPRVVSVSQCGTPDELADLIMASSCTPPFVPISKWGNETALDGGLVDNVPVDIIPENRGRMLVLLTRIYPEEKIPKVPGRLYVQPSRDIPIKRWDYTNPEKGQAAFDLGMHDAGIFVENMA
ncbi:MAG: hypothetical protein B6245_02435 [Desulfobacteraceae bacterium 4572_88]|nr:MAG: hypothetical protein B6245_02435 [Desulfobacteraceae bacterium 4572_88]